MVVKLWMAALNQKLGDRIESETLHATAQDSKNDVLATGAVLACAIVSQVTHINLDAWVGLAVGAYIGWSGFELIQDTVSPLLGQLNCLPFLGHEKWEAFFMRVDLRVKHDIEARKAAIGLFELGHGV